jgi:predicted TIM-barrel fold metal-dependent hydrolase
MAKPAGKSMPISTSELDPAEISFIDCDTHFMPLAAFRKLATLYPRHFQLIVDEDSCRFLYGDRVIHESRIGWDIMGAAEHGRHELESKASDMDREAPNSVQVFGYGQGTCSTHYPPGIGADVCRAVNDGVAELLEGSNVRQRFILLAAIYLPWVEETIREIKRTHALGFKGVFLGVIQEPYGDLSLGSQNLWPVYEVLNELDMPIIYHSGDKQWRDWSSYNWATIKNKTLVGITHDALQSVNDLGLLYGLPFTYACDIASLIFSGAFDRFPKLRICTLEGRVPSFVPALMDALDQVRPRSMPYKLARKPSEYFSNIYPGATATEKWLHHTVEAWPDHNIVLGSDYPHADASGTWPNSVRLIREHSKLSESDKERILVKNAVRLFNL